MEAFQAVQACFNEKDKESILLNTAQRSELLKQLTISLLAAMETLNEEKQLLRQAAFETLAQMMKMSCEMVLIKIFYLYI